MKYPKTIRDAILGALYPPQCASCDASLSNPSGMCELCLESCERIQSACRRCARPRLTSIPCPCAPSPSSLRSCTAGFEFGGQIAVALRRLKYAGRSDIARTLAVLLKESFASASAECDIALSVPLHRTRLRKRGFNQAQRLLLPLAKAQQLAHPRGLLVRTRATPQQSRLSRSERAANLRGAFCARDDVHGMRILLLDDIRTTGATLEAAAHALKRAGATEIHGYVVARTEWDG